MTSAQLVQSSLRARKTSCSKGVPNADVSGLEAVRTGEVMSRGVREGRFRGEGDGCSALGACFAGGSSRGKGSVLGECVASVSLWLCATVYADVVRPSSGGRSRGGRAEVVETARTISTVTEQWVGLTRSRRIPSN